MDDKKIPFSNRAFVRVSPTSGLLGDTNEKTGNGAPPPPTVRSKEAEQKILSRQQAINSLPTQTQQDSIDNSSLQTSAPVEPAEAISTEIIFPPVTMFVKFFGNGRSESGMFDNVRDIGQLHSDLKQRFGIEGELSLIGAGKRINDMSQLHAAWSNCEGVFHVFSNNKT